MGWVCQRIALAAKRAEEVREVLEQLVRLRLQASEAKEYPIADGRQSAARPTPSWPVSRRGLCIDRVRPAIQAIVRPCLSREHVARINVFYCLCCFVRNSGMNNGDLRFAMVL